MNALFSRNKGGEFYEGNKNRVNAMSNCGCACYPSIGAIGNNKPSLQVAH